MRATCRNQRAGYAWQAAGILMLAVTAASWGQVLQERAGRELDGNYMVGSGGSNTPVRGYVPINGNQIMTGNVSGLGYFHGNVPYSSPNEFSNRLGSSSLRSFARQSGGIPYSGTYTGGYSSYYLPSQTVSTSQGRINPGSARGMESRMTGSASVNPTSGQRPTASYMVTAPSAADSQVPLRSYRSALKDDPLGSSETSSLFGWRNLRQGEALNADTTPDGAIKPAARAGEEQFIVPPGQNKNQAAPNRDDAGNADPNAAPGDSSAVDGRLKPVTQTPAGERYRDGSAKPTRDGRTPDDSTGLKKPDMGLPNASESPIVASVRAELSKYQSADPAGGNYRSKQWVENRLRDAQMQAFTPAPVALPKKEGGKAVPDAAATPAPRTMGREPSNVNDVMNIADGQMRAGRYFQAASTYQNVLMVDAAYTPAMFARAHAELAAGMYESAAYDLRFMFDRYPDLVSIKSNIRSLMGDRVDFVIKDLADLAQKTPKGPANLLLAYCYYQTGQADKLKDVVDAWGKATPDDRWQQLAASEWVGKKTPDKK